MQQLQIPPLADGEIYIGAIGNKAGEVYHLILLPGDNVRATHADQLDWAKSIGGDLPNKLEALMLFVHAEDRFEPDAYWTNETFIDPNYPKDDAWAWCQYFGYGGQYGYHKAYEFRGRAVRRLPI